MTGDGLLVTMMVVAFSIYLLEGRRKAKAEIKLIRQALEKRDIYVPTIEESERDAKLRARSESR